MPQRLGTFNTGKLDGMLKKLHPLQRSFYSSTSRHTFKNKDDDDKMIRENDLSKEYRTNMLSIQMLSKNLHQQLFKDKKNSILDSQLQASLKHLEAHNLKGRKVDRVPEVVWSLPQLEGKEKGNVEAHFESIGEELCRPYRQLAESMANMTTLPDRPKQWNQAWSGWTFYSTTQEGIMKIEQVDEPLEDVCIFDVETCVKDSPYPVMAIALTLQGWYSWVCPSLILDNNETKVIRRPLISFGEAHDKKLDRLVIGHRIGFDRARIQEEYAFNDSRIRFLDTVSLHMSVSGEKQTSLKELYEMYFNEIIDKSDRDIFVEGNMKDIRQQYQMLMEYCSRDVEYTFQLFKKLWRPYLKKCPHPISFVGMLEMGSCYLPTDQGWIKYLKKAQQKYDELSSSVFSHLQQLVMDALKLLESKAYEKDPWLKNLDWTVVPLKFTKAKLKKDGSFTKNGEPRPVLNQRLPGKPAWFKDLCRTGSDQPTEISTRTQITPYLLRLRWEGFPLRYLTGYGWGFVIPEDHIGEKWVRKESIILKEYDEQDRPMYFFKIPHKDGEDANCGNPLSKEYLNAMETGVLASEDPEAVKALQMNAMCSYWVGVKNRVMQQFVHFGEGIDIKPRSEEFENLAGIILPHVVTSGTVTRRAVEPTWMTASNAKKNRVGSELKCHIIAPKNYCFVGADVDSEELWISALLGDSCFGFHGATALGWMTLQGKKNEGTDLHSKSASILGTSRENAKIFNYGRIYGAGLEFAIKLLMQFDKGITEREARNKATELYRSTKGIKKYQLKDGRFVDEIYRQSLVEKDRRNFLRKVIKSYWAEGSESYTFNKMEEIAKSTQPRTPVLNCEVTNVLHPARVQQESMTSRINWVVQSSGVDYLHLVLANMRWLLRKFGLKARLSITIHDEIRYLASDDDALYVALALQMSNLLTRAMFVQRLQMFDLPLSVAFFSAVDIDHILRKDVNMSCVTPSNPDPIPPGKSIDIYELLLATQNGQFEKIAEATMKISDKLPFAKETSDKTPKDMEKDEELISFLELFFNEAQHLGFDDGVLKNFEKSIQTDDENNELMLEDTYADDSLMICSQCGSQFIQNEPHECQNPTEKKANVSAFRLGYRAVSASSLPPIHKQKAQWKH